MCVHVTPEGGPAGPVTEGTPCRGLGFHQRSGIQTRHASAKDPAPCNGEPVRRSQVNRWVSSLHIQK